MEEGIIIFGGLALVALLIWFGIHFEDAEGTVGFLANIIVYIYHHFFQILWVIGVFVISWRILVWGDGFLPAFCSFVLGIGISLLFSHRVREFLGQIIGYIWLKLLKILLVVIIVLVVAGMLFSYLGNIV